MDHTYHDQPDVVDQPRSATAPPDLLPLLQPGSHGLLADATVPKVRLDHMVEVRAGMSFPAVREDPHGTINVLTMRGLPSTGTFEGAAESTVRMHPPRPNTAPYEVRPGDVLLVCRNSRTDGMTHRAVAVTACADQTVAANSILILRSLPRSGADIDPRYLAWYLNEASVQRSLEARCQGGLTTLLPADAVGDVEVPVPPRRTQEAIVGCAETATKLETLAQQRLELQRQWTRAITHNLVHGSPAPRAQAV